MSLTAELFGPLASSTPAAAAAPTEKNEASAHTAELFKPTKKTTIDLFALAPQVKKLSRRERQRLRSQGGDVSSGNTAKDDILKTVLLDDAKEVSDAEKKRTRHKKPLRHALTENKEEDSRTVFVGNLVNDVKRRTVEKVFKCCGAIECVRIRAQALEMGGTEGSGNNKQRKDVGRAIHVLRGDIKKGDQYSAVAYVLFKDISSVTLALEKNGIILDGRHIVVTAMDPESRAYAPETSVFIGNIAYDTNEEAVWNFFVEKGVADIKRVRLVRDRETGSCKGFGYVEFKNPASVPRAIAVRGSLLNGREVRIVHVQKSKELASIKPSRREKRKRAEQDTASSNKKDRKKNKRVHVENGRSFGRQNDAEGKPAWMGMTTNPRKKIPRDLRPLVESKRSRPASGPRAPVKPKKHNRE